MKLKFGKNKEKQETKQKREKVSVKDYIKNINKKYLKNGSYSMMISVVFIIIVVVVNLITGEIPSKYTQVDISDSKIYSIGEQTKSFLKDLEDDVTIYQVVQSGSEDETITNLLQKYKEESKHIEVVQKDPVVNPQFVSEYTSSKWREKQSC